MADGDGPSRSMNPAEKAAYESVQKTIRSALSAAPESYTASFSGFDDQYQIHEGMKSHQWSAELRKARDEAKPYQIAGYPMAFEQSEGCPDFGSYCVSILLGPFEKGKRAGEATLYTLRSTPLGVPTKPRGLMVVVSAPKEKPEKVQELLGRVDLKKLNALLP